MEDVKVYETAEMVEFLKGLLWERFDYDDIIASIDTTDYIDIIKQADNLYVVLQDKGPEYEGAFIKTITNEDNEEIICEVY